MSSELARLIKLIGCESLHVEVDDNVRQGHTVWKIFETSDCYRQVGQVESRFNSEYDDEPDGYAAYLEGARPTGFLPTVEEVAKRLVEGKMTESDRDFS